MILNRVYLVVIPNIISRGIGVTTEEVGNTAAFLLSPIASGVVGDIIYVVKGTHLI